MSVKPTNILLIEDNPADVVLFKNAMKDAAFRYELLQADSLFEAFDIINRQDVDIAMLDLSLPDSQGFKTLNRFTESVNHLPVIVLTGTGCARCHECCGHKKSERSLHDLPPCKVQWLP